MLVLSRRDGEQILVGDNVVIKVLGVSQGRVKVGIEAPRDVSVRRSELLTSDKFVSPAPRRSHRQPSTDQMVQMAH
jgi:carbon storage regulator